jgi:hypothetical protein
MYTGLKQEIRHMKKTYITFVLTALLLALPGQAHAIDFASEAGASARPSFADLKVDDRASRLRAYLASHDSPLVDSAEHFVAEADRLNLDWKLVAAIAGTESTFGKHIPTNSYNGWGWGVFTGEQDGIHFESWNDGITEVSEGLRYNYMDRGAATLDQIGRRYAASGSWTAHVKFFMEQIENFTPKRASQLAVTI